MYKRVVSVLLLLVMLFSVGITAYGAPEDDEGTKKEESDKKESSSGSSGSYKLLNDGKERKDPYGDSKLPSSFKGANYYDCFIPYQLTADDVGGWCTSVEGTGHYSKMDDTTRTTRKIGWYATWEGDCSWFKGHGAQPSGLTWSYEPDTGVRMVTDTNGTEYYVCAIQGFQYHCDKAGTDGFPTFGGNVGSCVEVICKDGTVIRFMIGDNNADAHTNGGIGDTGDGAWTPCKADGLWHFAPLKMKQYQNLFTGSATSHLELWGSSGACVQNFLNKYNFGNEDDKNKIAYYRIYNFNLHEPAQPVNDAVKKANYKLNISGVASSDEGGEGIVDLQVQEGLFAETHFVKWKVMDTPIVHTGARMIEGDMHESEIYDIENWKTDLSKQRGDNFLVKGGRWISILFGIIFEVWMMFIYLAYWFDRLNNFFDFSLLNVVTLGRLRISPDENSCTFSVKTLAKGEVRTINHKNILGVCIVGLGFGTLIISGVMFKLLRVFVNTVLEFLG